MQAIGKFMHPIPDRVQKEQKMMSHKCFNNNQKSQIDDIWDEGPPLPGDVGLTAVI